jgi:DnaJ-domain-containing protein 1
MEKARLKRKLRDLKRLETAIRFREREPDSIDQPLVWDDYFTDRLRSPAALRVYYPFEAVLGFDREERKRAFQEFLVAVYARTYSERGLSVGAFYNPDLLRVLGLPPGADIGDIKARFRELAKRHHPDHGGSSETMVELLEAVNRLLH